MAHQSISLLCLICQLLAQALSTPATSLSDAQFQWTVQLTVASSEQSDSFTGTVILFVRFADNQHDYWTIPERVFQTGNTYNYTTTFDSNAKVQYAKIVTSGMCNKQLRLSKLAFTSLSTGKSYSKPMESPVVVKDLCQTTYRGTILTQFEEPDADITGFCMVDGKRYEHGDQFNVGCQARCKCENGQFGCVDQCPASALSSKSQCQPLNLIGQCCTSFECEEGADSGNCKSENTQMDTVDTNYGHPSAVYVCSDKECKKTKVGAVLLSTNWAMSPYVDKWLKEEARLFIARANEKDIYRMQIDAIFANESAGITLFRIADYTPSNLNVQPANLPLNSQICQRSLQRACPFSVVGWTTVKDQSSKDGATVRMHVTTGRAVQCEQERGESSLCLTDLRSNSSCGAVGGGGPVFARKDKDVNHVVAMRSVSWKNGDECRPIASGTTEVFVNICSSLDWIRTTMRAPLTTRS